MERDNEETEARLAVMREELQHLQMIESPLVQIEREKANLMSDKVKLTTYIHKVDLKRQKLSDRVNRLKDHLDNSEKERKQLEAERDEVKSIVESQPISPQDVDRMQAEREQLSNTLEGIQVKIHESEKVTNNQEMKIQRIMDNVYDSVQEYSVRAFKLGFLSSNISDDYDNGADNHSPFSTPQTREGDNAITTPTIDNPLGGLDIQLKVNSREDDPTKITSVDLRRKVSPALRRARELKLTQLRQTQTQLLEVHEGADQLAETKQELEEHIAELESQVYRKQQQYVDARELMMTENKSMMHQIEQLEADIVAMRREMQQSEVQLHAHLTRSEAEWEMVRRQSEQRRKGIAEEVINSVDDVVQMSTHVQQKLRELQELTVADAKTIENP